MTLGEGATQNQSGDLLEITYANDGGVTPGVTYTYDRRGRQKTALKNGMTTRLSYNDLDQVLTEVYTGGTLGGVTVTSSYDAKARRQTLSLNTSPAVNYTFGYDDNLASRLVSVTDGSHTAEYAYHANSPLVSQITFKQGANVRMITTKQYDFLDHLTVISSRTNSSVSNPVVSHFAYQYNTSNQRIRASLVDGSFWIYEYDSLGQVTSGKRYWNDGTPVPGQQYEYRFDDIGNRRYAKFGGNSSGGSLRQANYAPNDLNQYTSRTTPTSVDVIGLGYRNSTVTITGNPGSSSSADYRKGEYFWESLPVTLSSSAPLWQGVSVSAAGGPAVSGNLLLPPSTQNFQYDADGNLTNDGIWGYYYDAENQLYRVENLTTLTPTGVRKKVTCEYDHQGRRIKKSVFNWASTDYSSTPVSETKFLYDGWNLVKEITGSAWKAYMWGLDLSGTEQGAGGVGGLLLFNDSTSGASFAAYDGNGNVVKLIKAADSTTTADYEYDPFGQLIRLSGSQSLANPFRFSTKYQDGDTDLLYYGYRFYSPTLGRWINRDPIEEAGGSNLLGFVTNDGINKMDFLGHYETDFHYYAIYYIMRSRCHTPVEARSVAYWSQNVDDNPQTDPLFLGKNILQGVNVLLSTTLLERFHFRGSSAKQPTRRGEESIWQEVEAAVTDWRRDRSTGNRLGTALHTFADTWSHEGFTAYLRACFQIDLSQSKMAAKVTKAKKLRSNFS